MPTRIEMLRQIQARRQCEVTQPDSTDDKFVLQDTEDITWTIDVALTSEIRPDVLN